MSKVNKAFSLDPEVFVILDKYCMKHEEIGSKRKSRSAVVNNAIRWYLGDTANLVNQRDVLQRELRNRNIQVDNLQQELEDARSEICSLTEELVMMDPPGPVVTESETTYRSWWRRLLLGR